MKPPVSRIMKRLLAGLAACLLIALPSARGQELLKDPGFEQSTPNGTFPDSGAWQKAWLFEAGAVCSTPAALQGGSGLWEYTGSTRSSWWAGQYQELEVPSDCVFTAVAWARTPPGEGWVDGSLAAVRIEYFLNDGQRLTFDGPSINAPTVDWRRLEVVTPPTPANIARVRFVLYLGKPASASGVSVVNFDDASLTVSREVGPPWITLQPANHTVAPGDTVTMEVVATGAKPFSYAWSFNGIPLPGATNQTLILTSAQANDAGAYAVTITNAEGASTSESATLTVLDQSGPVLELTHIPGYGTGENLEGRALNVPPSLAKVACAVGVPAIWTKPTFANPSMPIQPDGSWVADVTTGGIDHLATRLYAWLLPVDFPVPLLGGAGAIPDAYPAAALASVIIVRSPDAVFAPPGILTVPQNLSLAPGAAATFTVAAADDGSLTYQWYRGAAALPGATTPSLTIVKVTTEDAGRYSVAVRSAEGSESRVSALLEIETSMPPVIESQPEPWAAAAGETVRFNVLASGSAPLTYEWRHDGAPLPGGTRAELVLPDVRSSDSGFYSVTVRNSAGETVSHSVQLTVVESHEPTVVIISLPEYGVHGFLRGRVFNVETTTYVVTAGIFLPGLGWYAKPTCDERVTPLAADGTFSVNVATGGVDPEATAFAAFLVPRSAALDCFLGVDCLPAELEDLAVAQALIRRANPAQRRFRWSGEEWLVKPSSVPVGPGPNRFSDSTENVWVDDLGRLHLKITRRNGEWHCAEIINTRSLGYGRYVLEVGSPLDFASPEVIFGFFTWSDGCPHREIDFEAGRFGNAGDDDYLQFVVQPWSAPGHLHRFRATETGLTSHSFDWRSGRITFRSLRGAATENPAPADILQDWTFAESGSVPASADEAIRLNLWLFNGQPPSNGAETEVIVNAFRFFPELAVRHLGSSIELSWRATLTDFALERSPFVSGPWTAVETPAATDGDRLTVTLPAPAASAFFRLHRPDGR